MSLLKRLLLLCAALQSFTAAASEEITEDDFIDLIYAVRLGDAEGVIAGLEKGIPVDQIDGDRRTLMWHAISAKQPEIVELLADQGYDWEKGSDGSHLLDEDFGAALQSDLETLQAYIRGSSEQLKGYIANNRFWSPWAVYISRAEPELLEYCAEIGLLPQIRSMYAVNLEQAIIEHNHEMVNFLLQKNWGAIHPSAVTIAVYYDNQKALKKLIERGFSLDLDVAKGAFLSRHRFDLGRPLVSAVMTHNLPMVERLLEAGVDPKADNDAAILWADALGNKAIYDRLLAAGSKRPEPYEFLRLEPFRQLAGSAGEAEAHNPDSYSRELGTLLNAFRPSVQRSETQAEDSSLRVAIIQQSAGLEESTALLEARLSEETAIDLVDRRQLQKLVDERLLESRLSTGSTNRIGSLVGADALLYLRSLGNHYEVRVVSTSTGLILSTHYYTGGGDFNAWIDEVAAYGILGNLHRFQIDPEEATLISIPRIGTTGSSGLARVADQLTLALGYRLGGEPGVFLLDRHELQRLQLEQGLTQEAAEFYRSAWIVDGSLEPGNESGEWVLRLRLQRGTGKEEERTTLVGDSSDPGSLIDAAAAAILEKSLTPMDPDAADIEGQIFLQRGLEASRAGLHTYALASLRTAYALGVRSSRIRQAIIQSGTDILQQIREIQDQSEVPGRMEFLAWPPLSLSRFAYDAEVERLIDIAHMLLDQIEDYIQSNRTNIQDDIGELNSINLIFYIANSVLELLTPLSDRDKHGHQIESLRARLNSLTNEAIQWAGEIDLPILRGELLTMRYRSIPYWTDDEAEAIRERKKILEQIHRPEMENISYAFFNTLQYIYENEDGWRVSAYAENFWHRSLNEMRESQFANVRLLANHIAMPVNRLAIDKRNPEEQMEQWRSLMEGLEAEQRLREYIGDFGYFTTSRPTPSLAIPGLLEFSVLSYDTFNRLQPPRDVTFSLPDEILPEGEPGIRFDDKRFLLPEIATDAEGLKRDEAIMGSRLQRLADHWQKIQSVQGTQPRRRPPHELVPESHARALSQDTMISLREQAEEIRTEMRETIADTTLSDQLESSLLSMGVPTGWGPSLFNSLFEEVERREMDSSIVEVELSVHPYIRDADFFIPALEFPEAIDNPRHYHAQATYFGNYDQSLWVVLNSGDLLQFDASGKFQQLLRPPPELKGKFVKKMVVSPERIVAEVISSKLTWYAIYDRIEKSWEVLKFEGVPQYGNAPALMGDHLVFSLIKNQDQTVDQGEAGMSVSGSRYEVVKHYNLASGEERVLVDTRRVPPVSPLDQRGGDPHMPVIRSLENDEFLIGLRQIINLNTGEWRRANREEIQTARENRGGERHGSFSFEGVTYLKPRYDKSSGQYLIRAYRTPPEILAEQQRLRSNFTEEHQFEIPFPYYPESMEPLPDEWENLNRWIRSPDPSREGVKVSENGAVLFYSPLGFTIYTAEEMEAIMEHAWDHHFPLVEPSE
ncbi:ankyrin repeat domain-containing protein [Puniceicoccus vermicola]|uniref:Ankyrin repeat domain-containing protein n=1 Tax=Puniceicoccus vermicola TaxID=388746 RepID=A0A7X1AZR6_9BACT|nr:hypothetical protein [Puniceicoccus vermicola]MBC2602981.1 hypothetical protein [Puniceicoccus vermicola]